MVNNETDRTLRDNFVAATERAKFKGDGEAADYDRQLDDVQLIAYQAEIDRRTQALLSQGVPLPLDQITAHLIVGLLEQLVGRSKAMRVREWHLSWVDRMLDQTEAAVRARILSQLDGVIDDLPGFP